MQTPRNIMHYLRATIPAEYKELMGLRTKHPDKFNQRIDIWKEKIEQDETFIRNDLEFLDEEDITSLHYLNYDDFHNWEECKLLSEKYLKEKDKFVLFVSKGDVFKGRFVNELLPYKQEIKLATLCNYISTDGNADLLKTIFFIDSKRDKRRYNQEEIIEKKLWVYQFESNQREYIVLSEEKQLLVNCVLQGTLIKLEDELKIGESKTLNKTISLILLHSVTTTKPIFKSHKEMIDRMVKIKLNHKKYFNWLFSKEGITYDHPDYFQYLVSAFLLSAKEGFPLHLMILAKPGTGKSTIEECIHEKYDESKEIVEGSGSTIKALIPSFKSFPVDVGALLKANRICIVDEFFKILLRTHHEDREQQLGSLNPLLEHKDRLFSSGNGEIKGHATARCLFVGNTKRKGTA